jgi:hypothetical protein
MGASYEHHDNCQHSRRRGAGAPIQSLYSCANNRRRLAVLTGIGLVWEIAAAWIAFEIAAVTTALQVGYLASLLVEGLAIRPS